MLHKDTRKTLSDRTWLQLKEKYSNARLQLSRLKDQSIMAINDLSLMAQQLPEDTVSEIFSYDRVQMLIESILRKENNHERSGKAGSDPRRTYLGALLVEEGIKICIEKYVAQNRETPILTEATVDQLNQTIKLCSEIAYMVDLPTRKESKDNLQYQFNWNRVPGPDEDKFVKFIEDIFGSIYENFKDDGISTYEIKKNEPAEYQISLEELRDQYNATDKEFAAIEASHRTSEIILTILDPGGGTISYFSLRLRFSTKAVNLKYVAYGGKTSQLDTTNIVVKQDYGNFYIYRRK